ncbi:MAG: hypothetical protein U1E78_08460 [Gammaproteobacteria bacterium]
MRPFHGNRTIALQVLMLSMTCLVFRAAVAVEESGAVPIDNLSYWKKTLHVMERYSDLSFRIQQNQHANELAIAHFRVLDENMKMQVSANVFQQIRGLRKYSGLHVNDKIDVKINMIKSQPLTSKDTRILQNMTHFTTLQDSQGLSGKGVGVQFVYKLD